MDKQTIEQELAKVRSEREAFIRQAERQVAVFDGAIMAFERLLSPQPAQETDQAASPRTA